MPAPEKLIWQFNVDASEREFTYTPDGATVSDGQRTYTWDAANRMTSVTVGSDTYSWGYDGVGRRVTEKLNGNTTKRWVWNGLFIVQERDASNAVARSFYGAGIKVGAASVALTRDHLGSVREAVGSGGAVLSRYQYDLWGGRSSIGIASFEIPVGFTGHLEHDATDLVFAPYRGYAPSLARWISRDPLEAAEYLQGPNLYSYVNNNPIGNIDPDGRIIWFAVASGLVSGAFDVTLQMATNGGRLECVSWTSVGISVIQGATGGTFISAATKLAKLSRASHIARRVAKKRTPLSNYWKSQVAEADEIRNSARISAGVFVGGTVGRLGLPDKCAEELEEEACE